MTGAEHVHSKRDYQYNFRKWQQKTCSPLKWGRVLSLTNSLTCFNPNGAPLQQSKQKLAVYSSCCLLKYSICTGTFDVSAQGLFITQLQWHFTESQERQMQERSNLLWNNCFTSKLKRDKILFLVKNILKQIRSTGSRCVPIKWFCSKTSSFILANRYWSRFFFKVSDFPWLINWEEISFTVELADVYNYLGNLLLLRQFHRVWEKKNFGFLQLWRNNELAATILMIHIRYWLIWL